MNRRTYYFASGWAGNAALWSLMVGGGWGWSAYLLALSAALWVWGVK